MVAQIAYSIVESRPSREPPRVLTPEEWAAQQWAQTDFGDQRVTARAVAIGTKMVVHPDQSLPAQMQDPAMLRAAYRFLDNYYVTMEKLLMPHRQQTLAAAGRVPVVLMVEDTTELDYTQHRSTKDLGPIGNGRGQGLLLHSTLGIVPDTREVLGVAHAQAVLRVPNPEPRSRRVRSAESQVWVASARSVGAPPEGCLWVHVSDQASDGFEYFATCIDLGKHFLARVYHNRVLDWEQGRPEPENETASHLLDYARSLPPCPESDYTVQVRATDKHPKRDARVVLQWATVRLPVPARVADDFRGHAAIAAWVLRAWEPEPPAGVEPVEWVLLTSLPIDNLQDAMRLIDWYTCRWFCEDYHQCLKTGCQVERTQLDSGMDIRRLLGFAIPIAVRLLAMREQVRQAPDLPAVVVVEPLMVEVLSRRQHLEAASMTISEFWRRVARLGGHQGRRGDGEPGWKTLWKGWRYLSDLTDGARLFTDQQVPPPAANQVSQTIIWRESG